MICTFECTFCRDCVENRLKGVCPNCGGNFAPRPIRPASKACRQSAVDAAGVQFGRLRLLATSRRKIERGWRVLRIARGAENCKVERNWS
jgi:hypothetical protein